MHSETTTKAMVSIARTNTLRLHKIPIFTKYSKPCCAHTMPDLYQSYPGGCIAIERDFEETV